MKTESFIVSRFRNAELISLGNDVGKICGTFDWATSNVEPLFTNVVNSVSALKAYVNRLSTVNETQEITDLDLLFNNAWRAAKFQCKVYALSPDEDEQNSAHVINELFNSHGRNLHTESLAIQNTNARLFVKDCEDKEEAKTAILKTNFQILIDRIKLYLDNLDTAISTRSKKAANELRDNSAKELRNKLNEDLLSLFKYLEVMSDVMKNTEFTDMIKLINTSIQKIEKSIALRSNHTQTSEDAE